MVENERKSDGSLFCPSLVDIRITKEFSPGGLKLADGTACYNDL